MTGKWPPDPPPTPPAEETLWDVTRTDGLRVRCVLKWRRDLGFDAFIYHDDVWIASHFWTTRELAEKWADDERRVALGQAEA
jgi:hypothetical protein